MSQPLLSLVVPWFGGNRAPLERTIASLAGITDEVVIVHQKLFDDDAEVAASLGNRVATVDWNELFKEGGYGLLPNIGAARASSRWMMLLGVGETVAEQYSPIRQTLENSSPRVIFRCDHRGDVHTWGRIWSPSGQTYWSGPIHEECGNGLGGPVIFRMQDTPKEPHADPFRNECMKWMKAVTYAVNYRYLLHHPEKRGFTNEGWINFVNGSSASIEKAMDDNKDLMEAGMSGDREAFYAGVRRRMEQEKKPNFVNHSPTGQPLSEGAMPAPQ
jgi:hypothetical protein